MWASRAMAMIEGTIDFYAFPKTRNTIIRVYQALPASLPAQYDRCEE